ncbi:hypothetical protein DERP_009781 [Dermatophagoides pteronyssinus]|uniref:6-phosphofructokinase n=1 Tax=Dermatophagoides pteronyssinus TaxID=6956 RepID=A0ABQ8IR61_DERPT|nr:hypothetical protein DERP_009781 [Dermatophagoides pteronyssinus]
MSTKLVDNQNKQQQQQPNDQQQSSQKSLKSSTKSISSASTLTATRTSNIAVMTSGGDCQGMNSVLYGLLCRHLDQITKSMNNNNKKLDKNNGNNNLELYFIYNGFQGLIDGTSKTIVKANRKILQQFIYQAGTIINSSRCREFYQQDGRQKAAFNLLRLNIENLIVIGGDGSLTGANYLRREWSQYVREFIVQNQNNEHIDTGKISLNSQLNLIGIIGSIDNDFLGSEMTIGTDSALGRVIEAVDLLKTTAKSHSRAMVVEVMGRNCGYLAISAALCCCASYVFIPEYPHRSTEEWQRKLSTRITYERNNGQYYHIVIISEGACDNQGQPIRSIQVKDYLNKQCDIETRLIILGHLQRGGFTSAFDHLMSMATGFKAYDMIIEEKDNVNGELTKTAMILTLENGQLNQRPLPGCIDEMVRLNRTVREHNWPKVMEFRGPNFINTWENYRNLMSPPSSSSLKISINSKPPPTTAPETSWAIIICSKNFPLPSGINGIIFALVRYGYAQDIQVFGYKNGLEGLLQNNFYQFQWMDVSGIVSLSGTQILGSQIRSPSYQSIKINDKNIEKIIENLQKNRIKSLCFIGDHQAYQHVRTLNNYRKRFGYLQDLKFGYIPVSSVDSDDQNQNQNSNDNEIVWSKLGRDSMMNKVIRLISDLIYSTEGTFNQLFLLRINLDMISSATFVSPELFAIATGAITVHHPHPSLTNEKSKTLIKNQKSDTNKSDDQSIRSKAIEIRDSILNTNENKFVIIHYPLWSKIQSIYQTIIQPFQDRIRLNSIDMHLIQTPTQPSPFDRKLGVKLGMECARYFTNNNHDDTTKTTTTNNISTSLALMISTPFLNDAKVLK